MKRIRVSYVLSATIMATFATATAGAQQQLAGRDRWADSARAQIEIANEQGDIEQLRASRALVERALTAFANDALLQHYLAYALYRESNLLMGRQRAKESVYRPLLEQADSLLELSAGALPLAETYAMRSSVLGQMIGSNPIRGMRLGPRSESAMDRALELGPSNPRVWMLRGIGALFTPKMFGGGNQKAEEYLRKSIALFPSDASKAPFPSWGHAEAYGWLGQLLHKTKRIDDARAAYTRALELQPNNGWVRSVLVPALDRTARDR